ncbi:MAG: UvrD-helicase domain-containing protein [Lachnospiraceae bacterium]|nr:UvrD-helicase domain-containing protein [Lachnospiraceae bacterium]
MGMEYTPEQRKVIEERGKNLLVSAAAGSGKTAVLTERIVQMISDETNPVDIDRLLVVTFTNAAAAEMRERIGRAIEARLEIYGENEHLQKQSTLIHNAQITTIDSFCMYVIRNNFNEIGLDPGFRVADEGELKLLK